MGYHTINDLVNKLTEQTLINLTDDENAGSINTERSEESIQTAQNIIDGYLRDKYTLPLSETPGVIREISIGLGVYDLYRRYNADDMPKTIREDRDNALKLLDHIMEGKIALFPTDSTNTFLTNKTTSDRVFTKTELDKMP